MTFVENNYLFNWYEKKYLAEQNGLKHIYDGRLNVVTSDQFNSIIHHLFLTS